MSLWITDCQPATSADIERGVAAAQAVFSAAGLTPEHCSAQMDALAAGDDYGERGVATWQAAEAAALQACCQGWQRIPDSAGLELG